LQRRASSFSPSLDVYVGAGIRHVPRLKWINSVSNMDHLDASWKSQLESEFFSDLRALDLFHLEGWAQGLQALDRLRDNIGDLYGPILVSQVAGKLGMEAVQLAMQEGLCAGHDATVPTMKVGARLESKGGIPRFCTRATDWIPTMLDSVDQFVQVAIMSATSPRSAVDGHSNEFVGAVARLIGAICDLEFIRGVILARVAGNVEVFRTLKPGSRPIFAEHNELLKGLLGRHGDNDICGEAGTPWLSWLKDKMGPMNTFASFQAAQANQPAQRILAAAGRPSSPSVPADTGDVGTPVLPEGQS